jgi:hypothetical protein
MKDNSSKNLRDMAASHKATLSKKHKKVLDERLEIYKTSSERTTWPQIRSNRRSKDLKNR